MDRRWYVKCLGHPVTVALSIWQLPLPPVLDRAAGLLVPNSLLLRGARFISLFEQTRQQIERHNEQRMEAEAVANYLAHAKLAEQFELPELKMELEEIAADEAGRGRELRRLLKGLG